MNAHTAIDILAIEAEARRLRAQAMRDMISAFGSALRRVLDRRSAPVARNA